MNQAAADPTKKQEESFISAYEESIRDEQNLLQKVFDAYDLCFDLRSLRMFTRGIAMRGSKANKNVPIPPKKVVSVTGEFKIGKTWFLERLFNVRLAAGDVVQTTGLGVTLIERLNRDRKLAQFTCIDTAGTNVPVHEALRKDMRATEIFLRDLAMHLSSETVVLLNRYDGDAQETIRVMVEFLRQTSNSADRRLIVVHNVREATLPSVLLKRTRDLRQTFIHVDDLQWTTFDVLQFPLDPSQAGAVVDPEYEPFKRLELSDLKASLPQDSEEIKDESRFLYDDKEVQLSIDFYENSRYTHLFLVNDNTPWGKAYNDKVFDALLNRLTNSRPRTTNYLNEIKTFASRHLPKYIDMPLEYVPSWIEQKYSDGSALWMLVPSISAGCSEDDKKTPLFTPASCYGDMTQAFPLKRLAFVTGGRVVSEADELLRGSVFVTADLSSYLVEVEVPGVTAASACEINVRYDSLALRVKVDFSACANGLQPLVTTRPTAFGVFIADCSQLDPDGLFTPPPAGSKWSDLATIRNGVLSFSILRGMRSG